MKKILFATQQYCEELFLLRKSAYENSENFKILELNFLKVDLDRELPLIVLNENNEIISSVSLSVFNSFDDIGIANDILDFSMNFPAINISKSVTNYNVQRSGINSILRLQVFKLIRNSNLKSITGIVYEGAPRFKTMSSLGYKFFSIENTNPSVKIVSNKCFAILDIIRIDNAIKILSDQLADRIDEYVWVDTLPDCFPS